MSHQIAHIYKINNWGFIVNSNGNDNNSMIIVLMSGTTLSNLYIINSFKLQHFTVSLRQRMWNNSSEVTQRG